MTSHKYPSEWKTKALGGSKLRHSSAILAYHGNTRLRMKSGLTIRPVE